MSPDGAVNLAGKIVEFLALTRNTALLLGALVLALTGERLWLGFAPQCLDTLEARQYTMGIGVQSMVRRVPMMLGPLFGGWLVEQFGWTSGVRLALLVCILLALLTAVFQWFMAEPAVGTSMPNRTTNLAPDAKAASESSQPGAAGIPEPPSPPSDGGEGRGEERHSVRRPLSSILSPLMRRGERKKKRVSIKFRKERSEVGFLEVVNSFNPALRELLVSDILIRFC